MANWEEEENEICNDDGFIYKRRKRQEEVVSTLLKAPATATAVVVDLEAGLKQRKKRTITKLKDRYKKEILQWELLSNTLRELEQRTQQHQQTQQQQQQASSFRDETTESSSHNQLIEPRLQFQLDQHLSQAEVQAALIQNMTMLCDGAEAMCKAEEERVKKNFFNLPIWENPKTLFASLLDDDDDDECNNENAVDT